MKITPINYSFYTKVTEYTHKREISQQHVSQINEKSQISNVFYYPVNFFGKGQRVNTATNRRLKEYSGDFTVAKFSDVPCPACGAKMLSRTKFAQIAEDLALVPKENYLEFLGQYTDYMRPIERSVYEELCEEAEKKEVNTTDIRELLVILRDTKLPVLQKAQMRQVKKMTSLAKTLPEEEKKALESKIAQLKSEIRKKNSIAPFRRKVMIDRISKVKIRNPHKYQKLQNIAKNFPTSSDMNSAWIVKYSGKNKRDEDWDSYSIALRLLGASIANTDHIIAYDIDNTRNEVSNYLAMHSGCNNQKGNKPFLQWLNEDRENRTQYLQNYFDHVDEMIKSKIIKKKKYKNYVAFATKTIYEASKGEVKLNEELYPEKPQFKQ